MALGSVKVKGIGLGTAGVLFAGILVGHFGKAVDHHTLDFVKEFGLILFVFTIGLQLGPGFLAALQQQGVKLNMLAAAIVLLGAAGAPLAGWLAGFDPAAVLGIFSGASTNTPSLGAGTQTLSTLPDIAPDRSRCPVAYAVTYPMAIVVSSAPASNQAGLPRGSRARGGGLRRQESQPSRATRTPYARRDESQPGWRTAGRDPRPRRVARHDFPRTPRWETRAATDATVIHRDDRLAVVGTHAGLDQFERVIGQRCDEDLVLPESNISFRRVIVTSRDVLGKTVGELDLGERFGVAVTRVTRADIEMSAVPGLRLRFGDILQIVGSDADLDKAAAALGNSLKELNETHFIPFFIGITLGIVLGTLPIAFPGLPQPMRLGLAGGPLIVALILSHVGAYAGRSGTCP